jgi:ribosomal protein S18 acetylase RimI-like enzyme
MKVEKLFLTKENLIKIKQIDDKFYIDVPNIEWYLERYNENHYAYCLINKEEIIGYIVSVPIKKELYEAITNGVLINDLDINPKMFINESNYNYIISCVIKEEYRNQKYGEMLLSKVLIDLKESYACCMSITKGGYNLANKYMGLKMTLSDNVSIFVNKTEE